MKRKFVITSETVRDNAVEFMKTVPLGHEVVIKEHKVNRSADQNAAWWVIVTAISEYQCEMKEKTHEDLKERFLVPVFIRDDEGYASMWSSLQIVPEPEKSILKEEVLRLTSTTQASVAQMSEIIEEAKMLAISLGIRLPAQDWR